MAGRSPAEAVQEFVTPIQQTLSCLTRDVLFTSPGAGARQRSERIHSLTLAGGEIELSGGRADGLRLGVGLQFDVIKTPEPEKGPFKVRTRAYDYALRDPSGRTQVSYHWHPLGSSTYHHPHLHFPEHWRGIHFPEQRISVEEVVRLCIKELGAEPYRDDWDDVLALNEGRFKLWRTWGHEPRLAESIPKVKALP